MPCITLSKEKLFKEINKTYTDEEFADICFDFGIELDDILIEGEKECYKIELPANRCELLCFEGLSHFLKVFLGSAATPTYNVIKPKHQIIVTPEVKNIRPFCVAACLFDIELTKDILDSFIDFQEKLHQNICRKRTLVAIGTHDLDTICTPFTYTAMNPSGIKFRTLTLDRELNGHEILEDYRNNKHLKSYVSIIEHFDEYPIILDSKKAVMSLPPLINGYHSRLTPQTKNILIECTATNLPKAKIVLNSIVTCFSRYCKTPFSVGGVEVISGGKTVTYPILDYEKFSVSNSWLNKSIGVNLSIDVHCRNLHRMGLLARPDDSENITVEVPPNRYDIIHKCDIMEDAAISFGFNNIKKVVPQIPTTSSLIFLNRYSDMLRLEMVSMGYIECLSFILASTTDMITRLNISEESLAQDQFPVKIDSQYDNNCVRNSLIPGMLKTLFSNRKSPLPIKLFEVSDVVLRQDTSANGAVNQRNLCALYCGTSDGFEFIHGVLDMVLAAAQINPYFKNNKGLSYRLKESNLPMYLPLRCCVISVDDTPIGHMGILHPCVLKNFEINQAVCSCLEINVSLLATLYPT